MFWINLAVILVCLFRVGERAFHKKTQSISNVEFAAGFFLSVGALGNVLFGYSFIYGLIQLVGLLLALIQGVNWLYYRNSNTNPK